jgi:hypothetical protein
MVTVEQTGLVKFYGKAWQLTQSNIFSAAMLVCVTNALVAPVRQTIVESGLLAGLGQGFGVSWGLWLSFALAVRLGFRAYETQASAADLAFAGVSVAIAALPVTGLASVAATLLGLWAAFSRRSGPELRASALILLAISVNLLWAKVMMLVLAGPIEALDAYAVSVIRQLPAHGNIVALASGQGRMVIMAGCTSVANASLALLLWLAVTRSARPVPKPGEWRLAAAVFLTVVAINTTRLCLMASSSEQIVFWHETTGEAIATILVTASALAWALWGVRREIFA